MRWTTKTNQNDILERPVLSRGQIHEIDTGNVQRIISSQPRTRYQMKSPGKSFYDWRRWKSNKSAQLRWLMNDKMLSVIVAISDINSPFRREFSSLYWVIRKISRHPTRKSKFPAFVSFSFRFSVFVPKKEKERKRKKKRRMTRRKGSYRYLTASLPILLIFHGNALFQPSE